MRTPSILGTTEAHDVVPRIIVSSDRLHVNSKYASPTEPQLVSGELLNDLTTNSQVQKRKWVTSRMSFSPCLNWSLSLSVFFLSHLFSHTSVPPSLTFFITLQPPLLPSFFLFTAADWQMIWHKKTSGEETSPLLCSSPIPLAPTSTSC